MKINRNDVKGILACVVVFSIVVFAVWFWKRTPNNPSEQPPGITVQQVSVLQNLTTLSGKTYHNFRVQKVYADGVLIRHEIKPGDLSLAVVKFADLDSATKNQMGI